MVLRRMSGAWDKAGSRGRAMALAMTAAAGLASCESTPKYVNPVELYRSAAGFTLNDDTTGERNAQNLEAGSNQPYPNLGTVPPPPDRAMSSIDRQKLQQGLADDRAQARQSDADLRASGTATASGAPRPITRPSSAADSSPAATKHGVDPSLPGGRAGASNARRRSPSGSDPAPQETALNSPAVHALPEGDTPRAPPPPPSLPPPENARKAAADQAAKPAPGGTGAKRPSPAPQAAAVAPQPRPTASSADTGSRSPTASVKPPAEQAARIPPPPPPDMMAPSSDKTAAAASEPSVPPTASSGDARSPSPTAAPEIPMVPAVVPPPAASVTTPAEQATRIPPLPPAGTMAPSSDRPAVAASERPVPPIASSADVGSPSSTAAPEIPTVPAAVPPADASVTSPAEQATRIPPPPPADMMAPSADKTAAADKAATVAPTRPIPPLPDAAAPAKPGSAPSPSSAAEASAPSASWPPPLGPSDAPKSASEQAAASDTARLPQVPPLAMPAPTAAKPPEQQIALAQPPQAAPRSPAPEPPPQRSGRAGTVSLQAAEINFANNGLTLTPDDDRRLADVVKLYDKHGGVVRVVGYGRRGFGADAAQQELASFSKAIERANVVAKALAQLGLASNRIVVQAAPIGDGLGEDRAEVLLEF